MRKALSAGLLAVFYIPGVGGDIYADQRAYPAQPRKRRLWHQ